MNNDQIIDLVITVLRENTHINLQPNVLMQIKNTVRSRIQAYEQQQQEPEDPNQQYFFATGDDEEEDISS